MSSSGQPPGPATPPAKGNQEPFRPSNPLQPPQKSENENRKPNRTKPPPLDLAPRETEEKEESLLFEDDSVPSPISPFVAAPMHALQKSDDSSCSTVMSGSVTSFRMRFSQFSIDNSCFDLGALSGEPSVAGTPVEKVFPKDAYCAALLEKVARLEQELNEQKAAFGKSEDTNDDDDDDDDDDNAVQINFPHHEDHEPSEKEINPADTKENERLDVEAVSVLKEEDMDVSSSGSSVKELPIPLPIAKVHTEPTFQTIKPFVRQRSARSSKRSIRRSRTSTEKEFPSVLPVGKPPSLDLVVGGPKSKLPPWPPSPDPVHTEPPAVIGSPSTSQATSTAPKEERVPRKMTGKRYGNLRLIEVLRVKVIALKGVRGNSGSKPLYVVGKLDQKDIHHSPPLHRESNETFMEEFCHEGNTIFTHLHIVILEGSRTPGKAPRPLGRVSIRRRELARHTGHELVLPLQAVSKYRDVQGQICLDIRRNGSRFALKVVDYCGLALREPQELYLLVSTQETKEPRKLRIHCGRFSEEWLDMACEPAGVLSLKMTLWHDLLRGLNTVFHGQVRVDVDERWTNGPSKWFYLRPRHSDKADDEAHEKENAQSSSIGEVRLWMSYTADHVLPAETYTPLMTALSTSLTVQPFSASLISLLENLPRVDLSLLSRPLVQALAFSKHLRPLLSSLYVADIDRCQDLNTLFRSQTLATKMLYELLKTYGHSYLLFTLKPVIDKIYKERKCCEIDPLKLNSNEALEKNTANLLAYFSMAFSRIVESASRCPQPIKQVLADLRRVVSEKTGRLDVERLALSSFLIMRFFAAGLLNPKYFGLKSMQPEPRVARTLVLLSKMLQRLANCCVSDQQLSTKEPWLTDALNRVTDDIHKASMLRFLDRVSLHTSEPSVSAESIAILREGYLMETRSRSRPSWRKRLHQKKRYVILSDTDVFWQKHHRGELNPKGSIALSDIQELFIESKNIIVIKTETEEVAFEAASSIEANEWMCCIERQRTRARRMTSKTELADLFDTDIEREMEALHMLLVEHADTLALWRGCLVSSTPLPQGKPALPAALDGSLIENESERETHRSQLIATLDEILSITYSTEQSHRDAVDVYMKTIQQQGSGTRENPIGDDNYLLLKRRLQLS